MHRLPTAYWPFFPQTWQWKAPDYTISAYPHKKAETTAFKGGQPASWLHWQSFIIIIGRNCSVWFFWGGPTAREAKHCSPPWCPRKHKFQKARPDPSTVTHFSPRWLLIAALKREMRCERPLYYHPVVVMRIARCLRLSSSKQNFHTYLLAADDREEVRDTNHYCVVKQTAPVATMHVNAEILNKQRGLGFTLCV